MGLTPDRVLERFEVRVELPNGITFAVETKYAATAGDALETAASLVRSFSFDPRAPELVELFQRHGKFAQGSGQ